jgi:Beta/Gamma crystallin
MSTNVICVYDECNYKGNKLCLKPGKYSNLSSQGWNWPVQSMKIPPGFRVIVYSLPGFEGIIYNFSSATNLNCLTSYKGIYDISNLIQSLEVTQIYHVIPEEEHVISEEAQEETEEETEEETKEEVRGKVQEEINCPKNSSLIILSLLLSLLLMCLCCVILCIFLGIIVI